MNNEKSLLIKVVNKIYQLIILNIITLFSITLGLGIFSLIPSLVSMVSIIKMEEDLSFKDIIKYYYKVFFKTYKKTIILNIFFIILIGLEVINVFYYFSWLQENTTIFFIILYYLSLLIMAICVIALINSCYVFVFYPYLSNIKMIKYAFKLILVVLLRMIILFLILVAFSFIIAVAFYAGLIILLSLFFYLGYLFLKPTYLLLLPVDKNSLNPKLYFEEEGISHEKDD